MHRGEWLSRQAGQPDVCLRLHCQFPVDFSCFTSGLAWKLHGGPRGAVLKREMNLQAAWRGGGACVLCWGNYLGVGGGDYGRRCASTEQHGARWSRHNQPSLSPSHPTPPHPAALSSTQGEAALKVLPPLSRTHEFIRAAVQ